MTLKKAAGTISREIQVFRYHIIAARTSKCASDRHSFQLLYNTTLCEDRLFKLSWTGQSKVYFSIYANPPTFDKRFNVTV